MPLTAASKRLHLRQLLLAEIGEAGQERLCAARTRLSPGAAADAGGVALDYLARAGVTSTRDGDGSFAVDVPGDAAVDALAGDPQLRPAAALLAGAFGAVETIKAITGAGRQGRLPAGLVLAEDPA